MGLQVSAYITFFMLTSMINLFLLPPSFKALKTSQIDENKLILHFFFIIAAGAGKLNERDQRFGTNEKSGHVGKTCPFRSFFSEAFADALLYCTLVHP